MSNKIIPSLFIFWILFAGSLHAQTAVSSRIVVSPQYLVFHAVQGSTATQSQTFMPTVSASPVSVNMQPQFNITLDGEEITNTVNKINQFNDNRSY